MATRRYATVAHEKGGEASVGGIASLAHLACLGIMRHLAVGMRASLESRRTKMRPSQTLHKPCSYYSHPLSIADTLLSLLSRSQPPLSA